MHIEHDVKLDFDSVLIRPKRSILTSRNDVKLNRTYTFLHTKQQWTGIGVIAANMDTVGTMTMAKALAPMNALTALHKHYSVEKYVDFYKNQSVLTTNNTFYSLGISDNDLEKLNTVENILKQDGIVIQKYCIDVANGYTESFVNFVKKFRNDRPQSVIMAGNVVTGEMTEELLLSGADIIKIGIGPGCWVPGTLIKTRKGLKPIENIVIGDIVLTHKGNWQEVTNIFCYEEKEKIISINGNKSTLHHEYLVLHKRHKKIKDNLLSLAKWMPAEQINKNYYLLEYNAYKNLSKVEITDIHREPYIGPVYDLEVLGDHSYNVNGILVHNSVCETRKMTGIGYPQLSAVIECADAAHGIGGMICSDGGCKIPADIVKSFAGGADFTMIGGMLAGHDECECTFTNLGVYPKYGVGAKIIDNHCGLCYVLPDGTTFDENCFPSPEYVVDAYPEYFELRPDSKSTMQFYGMSSTNAMNKYNGGVAEYRASEGKCIEVPYKGNVTHTMNDIYGGLRSACTYTGSKSMKELSKRATFIKCK